MSKNKKITISVFLTAFAFGLNITGISPILGILNAKYESYGTSMVQLLQTLPYLMLMVGSLLIGWLTTKISKKKITIYGLFLIGICGILPIFSESFLVLFLSRLLIGLGFGMIGPMNPAIVSDFFLPQERASYMGLHVVGMGVGTMVGNLLGGMLAGISYQYFYLIYLIPFLAIAGVWLTLIETPPIAAEKASDMKLNKMVFAISFASFLHTLFINAYSTNIGIYILENITENPTAVGIATALNAACALCIGLLFSKIAGILKNYTLAFSVFAAAAGYGILLLVPGMAGVYLTSMLCGISLSCFMANGSYLISISVKKEAVAKASGMFAIIGGIGGLIAPIAIGNTAKAVLGTNTSKNQFLIAFAGMLIFAIGALIASKKLKTQNEQ